LDSKEAPAVVTDPDTIYNIKTNSNREFSVLCFSEAFLKNFPLAGLVPKMERMEYISRVTEGGIKDKRVQTQIHFIVKRCHLMNYQSRQQTSPGTLFLYHHLPYCSACTVLSALSSVSAASGFLQETSVGDLPSRYTSHPNTLTVLHSFFEKVIHVGLNCDNEWFDFLQENKHNIS